MKEEKKEKSTLVDAICAAMQHRGVSAYYIIKGYNLPQNLSTHLKNREYNFQQKTLSKIREALNVAFAEDGDGWYFSPLDNE